MSVSDVAVVISVKTLFKAASPVLTMPERLLMVEEMCTLGIRSPCTLRSTHLPKSPIRVAVAAASCSTILSHAASMLSERVSSHSRRAVVTTARMTMATSSSTLFSPCGSRAPASRATTALYTFLPTPLKVFCCIVRNLAMLVWAAWRCLSLAARYTSTRRPTCFARFAVPPGRTTPWPASLPVMPSTRAVKQRARSLSTSS
mmetsp:Transcript_34046/g.96457  ORF Transcript_34046/g.96457 Transcript_34046/m.96457 type:complete len:202 (+) Transcript_34046:1519-2124(+)